MSIEGERSWVIDIEKKLSRENAAKLFEEEVQCRKPSIFRLPDFMRMMKPDVFTPKAVAIGPYHHNKSHLQLLECQKERALHHFLKRGVKCLDDYVRELKSRVEELQGSYADLDEEWKNQDNFIKLMITDGCFMLEVMRLNPEHCKHYYAPSDPFFGPHALKCKVPYMRRDMLILENQLPILVFKKLLSVEMNVNEEAAECMITELMLKFFVPSFYGENKELAENIHGFHALDIYRRSRLFISTKDEQSSLPAPIKNFAVMPSAIKLSDAGIIFKQSKSSSIAAIHFDKRHGILTLPHITVDDNTEYEFLNMVALEHLHADCSNEISSYVDFMDALVNSAEDVQLLIRHGLVNNRVGSDKDFARLFRSMSREVRMDLGGTLGAMQEAMENYCQNKLMRWRADFTQTYLRDPLAFMTFYAFFFLTLVSTIVSILQLKKA